MPDLTWQGWALLAGATYWALSSAWVSLVLYRARHSVAKLLSKQTEWNYLLQGRAVFSAIFYAAMAVTLFIAPAWLAWTVWHRGIGGLHPDILDGIDEDEG